MEYRDDFGSDNEEKEGQGFGYGPEASAQSSYTRIDTAEIKPAGTGCRACAIFILLVGATLGLIYFYYQNQPQNQPVPGTAPPGQMQQK